MMPHTCMPLSAAMSWTSRSKLGSGAATLQAWPPVLSAAVVLAELLALEDSPVVVPGSLALAGWVVASLVGPLVLVLVLVLVPGLAVVVGVPYVLGSNGAGT